MKMNKIDYNIGILERLISGYINNKPYVMLDDAEYIIKNSGILDEQTTIEKKFNNILDIIDIRPGEWPSYYDDCDAKEYHEYFIKGTNIKLGFKYIDGETGEENFYCIVCDGYDQMDPYDSEEKLFEHFEWMLMNEELIWRYYD